MTLPCDTPFLPKNIVKEIIKLKNKELDVDLVVAQSKGYNHPVIALWKSDLNLKLEKALNEGIRKIDIFTSSLKVAYVDFDKINNDNAAQITHAYLPCCGSGCFKIGFVDSLFKIAMPHKGTGINIDSGHGLCLVNHQMATRF